MADASVIIRFSNMSSRRRRNLHILLNYIKKYKELEIIVSIMDKIVDIPSGVKSVFTPGTFESSKANNIGANLASTNIFVFQDADIIFNGNAYKEIIQKVKEGYEMVRVGEKCIQYGECNMRRDNNWEKIVQGKHDCVRDAPGACIALSRAAFIKVGGHCELFKVYGWEDCYMRYKCQKMLKHICLNKPMLHLPHEDNFQGGLQKQNSELYYQILNGNVETFAVRDREDLDKKYKRLTT